MIRMATIVVGVGALLLTPTFASAMTEAECTTAWKTADANGDGFLTEAEGRRYFAAMRVAQKPIVGERMTSAAFMENCKAGAFTVSVKDPAAPLAGANSFTEAQAKDRAMAAGFSNVSALKKDDKGVWRGTATEGTKTSNVAIDFKGNVVGN